MTNPTPTQHAAGEAEVTALAKIMELTQSGFIAIWDDNSGDYFCGCPFCLYLANAAGELGHADDCPVKAKYRAFGKAKLSW